MNIKNHLFISGGNLEGLNNDQSNTWNRDYLSGDTLLNDLALDREKHTLYQLTWQKYPLLAEEGWCFFSNLNKDQQIIQKIILEDAKSLNPIDVMGKVNLDAFDCTGRKISYCYPVFVFVGIEVMKLKR